MFRKFKQIVCIILVISTVCIHANAADTSFNDVDPNNIYYSDIENLHNLGIITGDCNGNFNPNDVVTYSQWATMLIRAWRPDKAEDIQSGDSWEDTAYNMALYCWANGLIHSIITKEYLNTPVQLGVLLDSAFNCGNILSYNEDYLDLGYSNKLLISALDLGKKNGLCDSVDTINSTVTRGEAAHILNAIISNKVVGQTSEILDKVHASSSNGYALGEYIVYLDKIPSTIIDSFSNDGWTFDTTGQVLNEYREEYLSTAIGVTDYDKRIISVGEKKAIIHEFGHYAHFKYGNEYEMQKCFNAEKQASLKILGEYSLTSSKEYFAEWFNYYILYKDSEPSMEKFKATAPQTYKMFIELDNKYWS